MCYYDFPYITTETLQIQEFLVDFNAEVKIKPQHR